MIIRSSHFAFDVTGADAAMGSLFYPADLERLDEARLTGIVPPAATDTRRAVVVILPGINVDPSSYRWLAERFAAAGHCAVTYTTIGAIGPAGTGMSPGVDMSAMAPEVIGQRPSSTALGPILDALGRLGHGLPEILDLDRLMLVGHSAGGTVALHNAKPEWFPGVRAVAAFGAHTMTTQRLGYGESSIIPIPSAVPIALIEGADDGVIEASRSRYRSDDGLHDPVGETFDAAISSSRNDCWMFTLANGNHFTICDPIDETSGRSFLEAELRGDDRETRELLAATLTAFACASLGSVGDDGARQLEQLATSGGFSRWKRK